MKHMISKAFIPQNNKDEQRLFSFTQEIKDIEKDFLREARLYNDTLCKPLGSLGKLESMFERLYAIFKGEIPEFKKAVIVYSSDNGVFEEGISSNPQETTYKVCRNIIGGGSGLCNLAKFYNVHVELEDLGVLSDVIGHTTYKIRKSTGNIRHERAMERKEAAKAILAGIDKTTSLIQEGYNIFGAGEMGVGNTTTSAAVIAAILSEEAEKTAGLGSGLTDSMYQHKIKVIEDAIRVNSPFTDILDVCAKLSGFDILGMAGTYLACAKHGLPFVLDGVISMAALLISSEINPLVLSYAFPSHSSAERGARLVAQYLNLTPFLDLDMRLGEGSGCPIAMSVMESAVYTLQNMATFDDVKVLKKDYIDIRKEENN